MKTHWTSWVLGAILFLTVAFGISWATITALNQLFNAGIMHSFLSYVNMFFLLTIIRGLTTHRIEKMQVRK